MRRFVVALVFLMACNGGEPQDSAPGEELPVDADGDGSPAEEDCNDADGSVFPGATEDCDGVDDDCDDVIDEEVTVTVYADVDGDGFGDLAAPSAACAPAEGTALDATDCDDADPTVNPGATEACNGVDDDCDAETDEGLLLSFFPDPDGDGVGGFGELVAACAAPEGYAPGDDDCAPEDAAVFPGAEDVCNGIDDDCDEETDEGSPDLDADGVVDCLDDACEVTLAEAGAVEIDAACVRPPNVVEDPWNIDVEWTWTGPVSDGETWSTAEDFASSAVTPVVGYVVDTDLDGDVDRDDAPVVVVNTLDYRVYVLDPATQEVLWTYDDAHAVGAVVLIDVDGEPGAEVVTYDREGRVVALDRDGEVLWTSTINESAANNLTTFPTLTAVDLDGDGRGELLTNKHVLSAADGSALLGPVTVSVPYSASSAADLDRDGSPEILIGNQVLSLDGTVQFTSPVAGNYGHWAVIANFDEDDDGEVVFIGSSRFVRHDADGTIQVDVPTTAAARPGPACVADFDGDGAADVAWASGDRMWMFHADGSVVWDAPAADPSGIAGCAAYDIDGDGSFEIVFAGATQMFIYDGATGAVRYQRDDHSSATLFEYPAVVDVDQDGAAEILYVANYLGTPREGRPTLTVLGHVEDAWYAGGSTWPSADFSAVGPDDAGRFPEGSLTPWTVYNVYRGRPSTDTAATRLSAAITADCTSSCDESVGTLSLAVALTNHGAAAVQAPVSVAIVARAAEEGGTDEVLGTVVFAGVGGASTTAAQAVTVPLSSLAGRALAAVVDPDNAIAECDEAREAPVFTADACAVE